jgi:hypothetical protein
MRRSSVDPVRIGQNQQRDRCRPVDEHRDRQGICVADLTKLDLNNRVQIALLVHDTRTT